MRRYQPYIQQMKLNSCIELIGQPSLSYIVVQLRRLRPVPKIIQYNVHEKYASVYGECH